MSNACRALMVVVLFQALLACGTGDAPPAATPASSESSGGMNGEIGPGGGSGCQPEDHLCALLEPGEERPEGPQDGSAVGRARPGSSGCPNCSAGTGIE